MKIIFILLMTLNSLAAIEKNKTYIGLRHSHSDEAKLAYNFMAMMLKNVESKGRVQLFELKNDLKYEQLPAKVKKYFFQVRYEDLINPYNSNKKNLVSPKIHQSIINGLDKISLIRYQSYVENLVTIGNRRNGEAVNYISSEFEKIGLEVSRDYNVIATLKGEDSNFRIVVVGHMDTVSNTVGADDNASGASGVLELARSLTEHFENTKPKYDIVFLVSEDEEIGLKGAKDYVKKASRAGELSKIKFVINMDMIAYNTNGVVDLETDRKFESQAKYIADMAQKYTSLKTNLVLNPWGSDHMPFIDADIPAVLSIETWKTHTPCWHKSCDTIDSLNFNYAIEILKMNFAAILGIN